MEWVLYPTLLLVSLILLIKQGLCDDIGGGILCYDCNSYDDARCGHPFQAHHFTPVNCSNLNYMDDHAKQLMIQEGKQVPNLCRKNYQTVKLGGKTDTRIVRSCGYVAKNKPKGEEDEEDTIVGEERCYRKAGTFEVMIWYCTCTTSKCNSATSFVTSDVLTLCAVFFTISSFITLNLPILPRQ